MTNLLKEFLASRREPEKQQVVNVQGVTREEFGTLVKVVEALVEDMAVATSPEKLTEAMNAAVKPLLDGMQANSSGRRRQPLALPSDRAHLAPKDDDDGLNANAKGSRRPLALSADRAHLAPKGD